MSKEELNIEIDYDTLVQESLRNVVKLSLESVKKHGLNGENHFYITFDTKYPGVEIHQSLLEAYPSDMTIVLQYQFYSLEVEKDRFSVELSFSGAKRKLIIPYKSISYFADPHAKFGLQFSVDYNQDSFDDDFNYAEKDNIEKQTDNQKEKNTHDDNVVTLDAFRKK